MRIWFATIIAILTFLAPLRSVEAIGSTGDAGLCDAASVAAARAHDVPVEILRALTRTETGRSHHGKLTPWPWTVNMEGEGFWFKTRDEAFAFLSKHHARGARSFDVGCFQINFRWHGQAFGSLEMMLDQARNADYAARFLADLKVETGSWAKAVGHYHSRTAALAEKYRTRFDRILAALSPYQPDRNLEIVESPTVATLTQETASPEHGKKPGQYLRPFREPIIGRPRHARMPGGVRLAFFSSSSALLTKAAPLFQRRSDAD